MQSCWCNTQHEPNQPPLIARIAESRNAQPEELSCSGWRWNTRSNYSGRDFRTSRSYIHVSAYVKHLRSDRKATKCTVRMPQWASLVARLCDCESAWLGGYRSPIKHHSQITINAQAPTSRCFGVSTLPRLLLPSGTEAACRNDINDIKNSIGRLAI